MYQRRRLSNQERIRQALEEANQSNPFILPPELTPPTQQSQSDIQDTGSQDITLNNGSAIRGITANRIYWSEPENELEAEEEPSSAGFDISDEVVQQIQEQLSETINQHSIDLTPNVSEPPDIHANRIIGGRANFGEPVVTFDGQPMGTLQSTTIHGHDTDRPERTYGSIPNGFRATNVDNAYTFGTTADRTRWNTQRRAQETENTEYADTRSTDVTIIAIMSHAKGNNTMSLQVSNFFRRDEDVTVDSLRDNIESQIDRIINNRFFYFNDYHDEAGKLTMMHRDAIIKIEFYLETEYLAQHPRRNAFQSSDVPRITI